MNAEAVHPPRAVAVRLLAGILCLAAAGPAGAGRVTPGPPGYVHETFGVEDGLPSAGILEALQTADGYLWLATFDGLVRFDGVRFEVFDGERVPALGSNRIVDLLEDRQRVLWILSEQGHLARLAGGRFSACSGADEVVPCNLERAGPADYGRLHRDGAGVVWVGGRRGVYRIDGDRLLEVAALPAGHEVTALESDGSGRLWAGTRRGLWRAGAAGWERIDLGRWDDHAVQTLAAAAGDELWLSFEPAGIGRYRQGRLTIEHAEHGEVARGPWGDVWIGLRGRLLRHRCGALETVIDGRPGFHFLHSGRNLVSDPEGGAWWAWTNALFRRGEPVMELPSDFAITSLSVDRAGTLWATTNRSGELHAFHRARLSTLVDGLPWPNVYPLYEDRDGSLWAGGHFLARLPPGAGRFEAVALPVTPAREVRAVLRTRNGRLWLGTARGLFDLGGDAPVPPAQESADIFALAEAADGGLWVGTADGLVRRDPSGPWRPLGPPRTKVRVIVEDADGTLWLGTDGRGVLRYRGGAFTPIDRSRGLSSDLVRAIWPAPGGRLWIATENHGLNRLDPATVDAPGGPEIAVVGRAQGLHSSGVHALVDDRLGNLWMSGNQGISRAVLADLEAVADGDAERVEVVVYDERDGMLGREANGGGQQAGLRDRDGRIWFPTQEGVVRAEPRELVRPEPPPPIHLRSLRAGDLELPLGHGSVVELEPSRRSFTLAYSAPFFRAPERLRFRYRLLPYDEEWVDAGGRREAFYTRVPPGRYRFEVATGYEGAWSDPAELSLHLIPRFFETRGFLAVCLVSAGGLTIGGLRLRGERQRARRRRLERMVEERTATIADQAERLRELDRLKSQLFANLSHELRTPLTLILGSVDDALDGRFGALGEPLAEPLGVAARNARRLLGLVDQLLDVSRLEAGRLELEPRRGDLAGHLLGRIEAFRPLAERRGVKLSAAAPPAPVEAWFDAAQLEKVFDNLLGNALKFTAPGGRVSAILAAPEGGGSAEVTVVDDGPGIPPADLERVFDRFYQAETPGVEQRSGVGLGLALARQIVELHGGSIAAANAEGGGARFTVRLPLGLGPAPPGVAAADEPATAGRSASAERAPAEPGRIPPAAWAGEPAPAPEGEPDPGDDRTTVLVIDDDAEIRAYVRRHLEPRYRVIEASGGAEGLERARRRLPDLVISDLMMPGLDGNALFRTLREDPELELVPVILLTARADAESRLQGLREGIDEYLIKPFDPRELEARVDNLISLRRRLRERLGAPRGIEVSAIEATPADRAFLERVQALIEERLDDPDLSVEALAVELGCDRSHLLRRLRALVDETPSGLIRSLRLQRAAQLLGARAGAVNEIAYGVGFKSVAHFSNAFLERYGERPSAFAARHRSG
jgi:signal transduction histidine kinase/ligand-binding sensor domain-containing protein/DNA-binding response OmpR family regulator